MKTITEEPILTIPNLNKLFELHIDASNFALGSALALYMEKILAWEHVHH